MSLQDIIIGILFGIGLWDLTRRRTPEEREAWQNRKDRWQ